MQIDRFQQRQYDRFMPPQGKTTGSPSTGRSLREEAARQIFERYVVRLKNIVRANLHARIRQREGTSDLVQSALKSLFKGDHDYSDPDSLWPLLTGITLNKTRKAVERHRRKKRDVLLELSLSSEEIRQLATAPTLNKAYEIVDLAHSFMKQLSEIDQRVVWLRLEGWRFEEVASKLGMSPAAAKMKHGRAIARLRRMVEQGQEGDA